MKKYNIKKDDIVKDDLPVIYKQHIMNDDGKLNTLGTLLVLGVTLFALSKAFECLSNIIIDKDNVN